MNNQLNVMEQELSNTLKEALSGNILPDAGAMSRVAAAIVVKYGNGVAPEEALNKFNELAEEAIPSDASDELPPPLSRQLDALKEQVGPQIFERLLANPSLQQIAARAWVDVNPPPSEEDIDVAQAKAIAELAEQFNGAVSPEELDNYLQLQGII